METLKQNNTKNNIVEIGTQFKFGEDEVTPSNIVLNSIGKALEAIKLETRMFVFDALHGTNYRQIRHDLVEQEKRRKFEESIGLIAVKHK